MADERFLAEVECIEEIEVDEEVVSYDDELLDDFVEEEIVKGGDSRGRAWRRKKDRSKARRKVNIAKAVGRENFFKYEGQCVKGKIHCSCPLCTSKTNSGWLTAADRKKVDSSNYSLSEHERGEDVIFVEDLIKHKDYDYISFRFHQVVDDDEIVVYGGSCRSEGGELISLDEDDYRYEKRDEVLYYEEWEDRDNGIKNGLTVIINL